MRLRVMLSLVASLAACGHRDRREKVGTRAADAAVATVQVTDESWRATRPLPGPPRPFASPKIDRFELSNHIPVYLVESREDRKSVV